MMEMTGFYEEMVGRNIGVISAEEQEKIRNTCVAVAGCGGMGGLSAEQLVRLGVGHVKIADFDKFAVHNLSRQCCSTTSNVGQNKAEVLARHFKAINPELQLDVFNNGVTPENIKKFVDGAEVIIDGTDFSQFSTTAMIYDLAKRNKVCVICPNAIGFGVNVFVFSPHTVTLGEYLGVSKGADHRLALKKLLAYVPTYADLGVIQKAATGEISIPNIAMPQYLGTSIAVSEAVMMVLGKIHPPRGPNPRIFILDLHDRMFRVTG